MNDGGPGPRTLTVVRQEKTLGAARDLPEDEAPGREVRADLRPHLVDGVLVDGLLVGGEIHEAPRTPREGGDEQQQTTEGHPFHWVLPPGFSRIGARG